MTAGAIQRLSRAQLRIARRTAARLLDGGLVFAVGSGTRRRRDFEVALADEGVSVAPGVLDIDGDPWEQIVALGRGDATPCVSWPDSGKLDSFLGALNLGRERFGGLSKGLLMWIGGLDAVAAFPPRAPDLWVYRAGVEWVISADDWRAYLLDIAPRTGYPINIEKAVYLYDHEMIVSGGALAALKTSFAWGTLAKRSCSSNTQTSSGKNWPTTPPGRRSAQRYSGPSSTFTDISVAERISCRSSTPPTGQGESSKAGQAGRSRLLGPGYPASECCSNADISNRRWN